MSIDNLRLIQLVKSNAMLYDINHKNYKNFALRAAVWESIAKEFDQTSETIKNKWRVLRDGYTKYKKHMRTNTGSSRKRYQYMWSSQLTFLDSALEARVSLDVQRTPSPSLDSDHSQAYSDHTPGNRSSMSSPSSPFTAQVKLEPLCSISTEETQEESQLEKNNKRKLFQEENEMYFPKKIKDYDEVDHLFASYACTFKNLPIREQVSLKLRLAKLFANIELKLLQNSEVAPPHELTHYTNSLPED